MKASTGRARLLSGYCPGWRGRARLRPEGTRPRIADYPRNGDRRPSAPRTIPRPRTARPRRADRRRHVGGGRGGRRPRRRARHPGRCRPGRMQEARDVVETLVRAGRGRLRGHDRVRRPGDHVHPARGRGAAAGEPAGVARGRRRAPVPARGGPGDAPASREHARPRPFRLPARARGPDLRVPREGHPPGRAGAGERRRVRGPGAARAPRAAAHRARAGGAGRADDARAGGAPGVRPGAPGAAGEGGPGAPQRDPADERTRRAARWPMRIA